MKIWNQIGGQWIRLMEVYIHEQSYEPPFVPYREIKKKTNRIALVKGKYFVTHQIILGNYSIFRPADGDTRPHSSTDTCLHGKT